MPESPDFCQYPDEWLTFQTTTLGFPRGVAERSESFKIMIAGGNHSKIKKLSR